MSRAYIINTTHQEQIPIITPFSQEQSQNGTAYHQILQKQMI